MDRDAEELEMPDISLKLSDMVDSGQFTPSTPSRCQSAESSPGSSMNDSPPVITTAYIMSKYAQQMAQSSDSGFSYGSSKGGSDKVERKRQSHELGLRKRLLGYRTDDPDDDSDCRITDLSSMTDSDGTIGFTTEIDRVPAVMRQPFTMPAQRELPKQRVLVVPKRDLLSDLGLPMLPLHSQVPRRFGEWTDEYYITDVKKIRYSRLSPPKPTVKLKSQDSVESSRDQTQVSSFQSSKHSFLTKIPLREQSLSQLEQLKRSSQQESVGDSSISSSSSTGQSDGTSSCMPDGSHGVFSGSSSESPQEDVGEVKRKRFLRTKDALEKSGLLDVTLRTAKLIKENKLLQSEIESLKKQTNQFIQSIVEASSLPEINACSMAASPQQSSNIHVGVPHLQSPITASSDIPVSTCTSATVTLTTVFKEEPPHLSEVT